MSPGQGMKYKLLKGTPVFIKQFDELGLYKNNNRKQISMGIRCRVYDKAQGN